MIINFFRSEKNLIIFWEPIELLMDCSKTIVMMPSSYYCYSFLSIYPFHLNFSKIVFAAFLVITAFIILNLCQGYCLNEGNRFRTFVSLHNQSSYYCLKGFHLLLVYHRLDFHVLLDQFIINFDYCCCFEVNARECLLCILSVSSCQHYSMP